MPRAAIARGARSPSNLPATGERLCRFRRRFLLPLLRLLLVPLFVFLLQLAAVCRFLPRIEELGAGLSAFAPRRRSKLAILREAAFSGGNSLAALPACFGCKLTVLRETPLL